MYVYVETDKGVSKHMSATHGSYRSHIQYNDFTTCDFRVPRRGRRAVHSSGLLHSK